MATYFLEVIFEYFRLLFIRPVLIIYNVLIIEKVLIIETWQYQKKGTALYSKEGNEVSNFVKSKDVAYKSCQKLLSDEKILSFLFQTVLYVWSLLDMMISPRIWHYKLRTFCSFQGVYEFFLTMVFLDHVCKVWVKKLDTIKYWKYYNLHNFWSIHMKLCQNNHFKSTLCC